MIEAQSFTNGQAERAVIGQHVASDGFSGATQNILGAPSGVAYANGLLFVADGNFNPNQTGPTPNNNRVLVFSTNQIPDAHADLTQYNPSDPDCYLCGFNAVNVFGQPDYTTVTLAPASANSMNAPRAVATDGHILAVTDNGNNRVLIWNSIPTAPNQPANVVVGQADFTHSGSDTSTLRNPQGVWIQNGKLFVADTQNNRVLIWNSIPTSNGQPANVILGGGNTCPEGTVPSANTLCSPASVSSDGTHLFVADLGFNRVLIWNSIPTSNGQSPDVVIGQPNMTSGAANNSAVCSDGSSLCAATLNFPRFVLSDGRRLFLADSGDDRVLIFNSIPTQNGASADAVLGQPDFSRDIITNQPFSITSTAIDNTGAVDTIPTPYSLAWDGTNLYVADPYNRRVTVFTPGDTSLPNNSVVNWASEIIRQEGVVSVGLISGGAITANDTATVTIAGTAYTYTVKTGDTLDAIANGLVTAINANSGDPNVTAIFAGTGTATLYLSSKQTNLGFDAISLAASASNPLNLALTTSGSYLTAGTAATGAAGMLVEINGTNLSDQTVSAPKNQALPVKLGGASVLMDGIPAPLMSVSPNQIVAQVPFEFHNASGSSSNTTNITSTDRNSTSVYVRTEHAGGNVTATNATPLYIAPADPGLFNKPTTPDQVRPWPAVGAQHQSGGATAVVSIDGSVHAGDTATITVNGRNYTYTVVASDSLNSIALNLGNLINNAPDPQVKASLGAAFARVVLTAIDTGAGGVGIPIAGGASSSAQVTVTAYTAATCCLIPPNSPDITPTNPAQPGELITVIGTGLGLLDNGVTAPTGQPFNGTTPNTASNSVNATMNGVTAQVVSAGLPTGSIGVYAIQLIVPSSLSATPNAQLYIAQNAFISNIVTLPIGTSGQAAVPPGAGLSIAQVLVNPTNLTFAIPNSANINMTQTVTIYNPGTSALAINSIQLSGANASSFVATNNCGTTLGVGLSCTVFVTYTPASSGMRTASLVVNTSASASPQIVPLTGFQVSQLQIINKLSGKVLDVTGASMANGVGIQQYAYVGGPNQTWSLTTTTDGYYAIVNLQSGKVLDVRSYSTANGTVIQQWDYLGGYNQKWTLMPTASGYYAIVNVGSGKVLDVTGFSLVDGAPIQQWDYLGGDNQQWELRPVQYYEIVNVLSGKVLDLPNLSNTNGTVIQQWDYLGGTNQQWQILPADDKYYKIVNRQSWKVLDVTGASNASGALIQQFDYLGTDNQKWAFAPTSTGTYAIVNKASGRVLDVTGFSLSNATTIQQYDYVGGGNQQWQLVPIP
jgi:uncharacterized protein (TIGR03437 family)